jgi:hypothetical protein
MQNIIKALICLLGISDVLFKQSFFINKVKSAPVKLTLSLVFSGAFLNGLQVKKQCAVVRHLFLWRLYYFIILCCTACANSHYIKS